MAAVTDCGQVKMSNSENKAIQHLLRTNNLKVIKTSFQITVTTVSTVIQIMDQSNKVGFSNSLTMTGCNNNPIKPLGFPIAIQ